MKQAHIRDILPATIAFAFTATLCACGSTSNPSAAAVHLGNRSFGDPADSRKILVAVNTDDNTLIDWSFRKKGSGKPAILGRPMGLTNPGGIAANGEFVAIPNAKPNEVVIYDIANQTQTVLTDPYGSPDDIAIEKSGALDVLNGDTNSVTRYPRGSQPPQELQCDLISSAQYIAVDVEGDVLVRGDSHRQSGGVVEIPAGANGPDAKRCRLYAFVRCLATFRGSRSIPKPTTSSCSTTPPRAPAAEE